MNSDLVKQSQIVASAPTDTVLQNSAMGFLQGLYPPVGEQLGSNTLRNGTSVQTPLNGYQLIPLQTVQTGSNSENAAWLQGSTNCANAQISSNAYFTSPEYTTLLNSTQSLYTSISPMINRTFTASQTSYKNAYTIWDLLNVASIHNSSSSFPSSSLYTPSTASQLFHLANTHEWNLAYNATDPIRAITGAVLADQVVTALNTTITSNGKSKLNVQFGAYAGMLSFFGLANLTEASPEFYGIPDYASSLVWELVTNASVNGSDFPGTEDISVRFLFHNGTTSNISEPTVFPLFGSGKDLLTWDEFTDGMGKFSVNGQSQWCQVCGNTTGVCASGSDGGSGDGQGSLASGDSNGGGGGGISKAVAGVIGAMVTLAVVLGAELLILLVAGLRVVRKKNLRGTSAAANGSAEPVKA
jgi:hypothetical protein